MKILLVGSGGREHALAWKLAQSPLCERLYCAPGNPGMAALGELVALKAGDLDGLCEFAVSRGVGLVVVGPEDPLCLGLADRLREKGVPVFGPGRDAARLEGSKSFAKDFMRRHGVATAGAESFDSFERASAYVRARPAPLVVKADGLAAGKGVVVAATQAEAEAALRSMLVENSFGPSGSRVLVEDFLEGEEASLLCFCDGARLLPMASAQDHKRAFDHDQGPNTGGMGAYSPAPVLDEEAMRRVELEVLAPTLKGLLDEGLDYRGCLYVGLMLTRRGPKVVEYNARFGDPETQALVPRMDFDLAAVMLACARGDLEPALPLAWKPGASACVVLASRGYPARPELGLPVRGLEGWNEEDGLVFHAGTRLEGGSLVTSGGRVFAVAGRGPGLAQALEQAYRGAARIEFEGKHHRRDIGARALAGK